MAVAAKRRKIPCTDQKSRRFLHRSNVKRLRMIRRKNILAFKNLRHRTRVNPIPVNLFRSHKPAVKPLRNLFHTAYGNILRQKIIKQIPQAFRITRFPQMEISHLLPRMNARVRPSGSNHLHPIPKRPPQHTLQLRLNRRIRRLLPLPAFITRTVISNRNLIILHSPPLSPKQF